MQSSCSVEPRMKTSSPPSRRSRAASGIHFAGSHQMDAPYSEKARSNDSPGKPVSSALAWTNSSPRPCSSFMRRAVSSCAGDIDADDPLRPRALEPGTPVRRATAELDDSLAVDVGEHAQLTLGDRPLAPGDLLLGPRAFGLLARVLRIRLRPALAVDRDV